MRHVQVAAAVALPEVEEAVLALHSGLHAAKVRLRTVVGAAAALAYVPKWMDSLATSLG